MKKIFHEKKRNQQEISSALIFDCENTLFLRNQKISFKPLTSRYAIILTFARGFFMLSSLVSTMDLLRRYGIGWLLLFGVLLFLAQNRHSNPGKDLYHGEIWADKGGYYIYLPASFMYNWDAKALPDSLILQSGGGFTIDSLGKIHTKYPYGTALFTAPFFGLAHIFAEKKTGFSFFYLKQINTAAAFYLSVGILLLFMVLRKHFSRGISALTLLLLTGGTPLLYYGIIETGMSHIYSFFAFSLLVYSSILPEKYRFWVAGCAIGLIGAVRQINVLFLVIFIGIVLFQEKKNFRWKYLLAGGVGLFLFQTPQICYYLYETGSIFQDSYGDAESFMYWKHPHILAVSFAPNNGLFLYSPFLLLYFIACTSIKQQSRRHFYLSAILLAVYIYVYASWYAYALGCGFGHRAIVDILPLFCVGMGSTLQAIKTAPQKYIWGAIALFCLVWSLKLTFTLDYCYMGKSDWDWVAFMKLLTAKPL